MTSEHIRQAIAEVVGEARLDFSKDAAGAERADAVVVVVGEDPYAWKGYDNPPQNVWLRTCKATEDAKTDES